MLGQFSFLVGLPLLAVPHNLSRTKADSQEWLSYKTSPRFIVCSNYPRNIEWRLVQPAARVFTGQ